MGDVEPWLIGVNVVCEELVAVDPGCTSKAEGEGVWTVRGGGPWMGNAWASSGEGGGGAAQRDEDGVVLLVSAHHVNICRNARNRDDPTTKHLL